MLLLVIQVWDPFVISRFPVFTPSDRPLLQSVWGSEGELTVLAGAAHRAAGALLPDSFLGPPAGLRTMHICTQTYLCIFSARAALGAEDSEPAAAGTALPEPRSRPCARSASGSSLAGLLPPSRPHWGLALTLSGELQDSPLRPPGLNSLVLGFEVRRTTDCPWNAERKRHSQVSSQLWASWLWRGSLYTGGDVLASTYLPHGMLPPHGAGSPCPPTGPAPPAPHHGAGSP